MEYFLSIFAIALTFALVALSLELTLGRLGYLSLGHGAIMGTGAYAVGIGSTHLHWPLTVALGAALVAGTLAGFILGFLSLYLRSDRFVLASIAFQFVFSSVAANARSLTGGTDGIPGILWQTESVLNGAHVYTVPMVALVSIVFVMALIRRLAKSPFGRVMTAIRDNEITAHATAKRIVYTKLALFSFSGTIAGIGGALYALSATYVEPASFNLWVSVVILAMVAVGGPGTTTGPVLGALLIVLLPEQLRFLGASGATIAIIRQIVFGCVLMLLMIWRPSGLLGQHRLGPVRLKHEVR